MMEKTKMSRNHVECPECGNKDWIFIPEETTELRCVRCGFRTRSSEYPGEIFKVYGTLSRDSLDEVLISIKLQRAGIL